MTRTNNQYIKKQAVQIGFIEGYEYWIVKAPMEDAFNGYVVFPKRPVREMGYGGILTYVPVHGGITYAKEDKLGMVYGFDTLHYYSEKCPRKDRAWIRKQCRIMLQGILKAKEVEAKYLKCLTNKGKAKYAQQVLDINPNEEMNFGTCLNLLSGKV